MECKFSILVLYRMSCIRTTLKTYDDICILSKHICHFALSFIAPVCTNNSFYHFNPPLKSELHQQFISAFTPSRSLYLSSTGLTLSDRKVSTCTGAHPTYFDGSRFAFSSSIVIPNIGSAAISSSRSLSLPSFFT